MSLPAACLCCALAGWGMVPLDTLGPLQWRFILQLQKFYNPKVHDKDPMGYSATSEKEQAAMEL